MYNQIEDIILQYDKRGMMLVRKHLSATYCTEAAVNLLASKGVVFIVSGFYIVSASQPETDGPPAAILLGEVLEQLGFDVYFVTDIFSEKVFIPFVRKDKLIASSILDHDTSDLFVRNLLAKYNPTCIISIERCGRASDGKYYNMRGVDISKFNACLDALFLLHHNTIAIGDGGNEIGMGNLAPYIIHNSIISSPCVVHVKHLIISSVSNWGVYGLVAAMSILSKSTLMPTWQRQREIILGMCRLGAVDGITSQADGGVDGFSLTEQEQVYNQLLDFVNQAIKSDK